MAKKLEDLQILDETIKRVEVLKTESEHRGKSKKKDVLTSSQGGQVLNLCYLIEYKISHTFQSCGILDNHDISRISYL